MYDGILVATDGSDAAMDATEHAIDLAKEFDASLSSIAVVETRTTYDNAIVDPEEAERALREQAEESIAAVEAAASDAGIDVETTIRSGVPHEEVVDYAAERGVDVVVVGAEGRSNLRRALLGSTVDGVVRFADRPVLVVGN
ncbi:universal stress protein [Halosolutus amylolyticus]|uniref:Universal stress protein n=1 Tax=Halosolutus amylolyticus TaxID=2932267 RepID=A0ABD5PTJ2_9EURY|nr:universal stress protein [Halosolutus amylolyticus]